MGLVYSSVLQSLTDNFEKLQKDKEVIVCGDLNVAHNEIDLKNDKTNHGNAGFTDEERKSFSEILKDNKLIDTYRYLNGDKIEYSFWSYMRKSREKNIGWRIDYFLISEKIKNIVLSDFKGLIHIGANRKSVYDYALSLGAENIEKISIKDMSVKMPKDTSLNTNLYKSLFNEL